MRAKTVGLASLILLAAVLMALVPNSYCCFPVGDLDRNWVVDMRDLGILARAFGSYPNSANWNPDADLNGDGFVDIRDAGILLRHFGERVEW